MRTDLPWRRPRFEPALLALVALAALLPVYPVGAQDASRLCLTQAVLHGNLANDPCFQSSFDKASYGGHLYSDKAPGLSFAALPAAAALDLPPMGQMEGPAARLWGVRLLTSGVAFLLAAFLVGRVAEGLAPGCGGAALVAFALGTLAAPLAAASFGHLMGGMLGFAAFLLAWRRRFLLAGLLAGAAVVVEYQAGAILAIVGVYAAFRSRRGAAAYVAGVLPGAAVLAAYDALAFGSPFHLSYRYVANGFSADQARGFFGIALPHLHTAYEVLAGGSGLLVLSPVLAAAAWGLVLLGRRSWAAPERPSAALPAAHRRPGASSESRVAPLSRIHASLQRSLVARPRPAAEAPARPFRAEAVVCGAITVFFLVLDCGYFLPYGGVSPGPRFFVPALPFLAVGLGPAFAWRPRLTTALAAVSVVATLAETLYWSANLVPRQTIWGEFGRALVHGSSSRFARHLTDTALGYVGLGRLAAPFVVAAAAAAALALATRSIPPGVHRAASRTSVRFAVPASLALVAVANASALAEVPYGRYEPRLAPPLLANISSPRAEPYTGGEVDFLVALENQAEQTTEGVRLTIQVPQGMRLLGAPWYQRGSGCRGTTTVSCDLDYLEGGMTTLVRLGVRITALPGTTLELKAWGSVEHDDADAATYTVKVV